MRLTKKFRQHKSPQVTAEHAPVSCANCGASISGNYCSACGQSAHIPDSLLHLIEEVAHGLWHFDAKGWRTIPMLIAFPGELTRRFIDGQRVRFISPLALFLFTVFFMFFVFSFSAPPVSVNQDGHPSKTDFKLSIDQTAQEIIEEGKQEISELQADIKVASGDEKNRLQANLAEKILQQNKMEQTLKTNPAELLENATSNNNQSIISTAWISRAVKHATENPELFKYKLKNYAYKFALILVPLSMPFLWLMFFWRHDISMFDHAVFSLYSLSFMALLISLVAILFHFNLETTAIVLLVLTPPIHMFRQLQGTYQLGTFSTLWRTSLLVLMASILVVIFMLFITGLSAS